MRAQAGGKGVLINILTQISSKGQGDHAQDIAAETETNALPV